ncbi:MAG: hypothetical protein Crog4KO_27210 [Crocinitomicaceae bacterium]
MKLMRNRTVFLAVGVVTFLLVACGSTKEMTSKSEKIPFETIYTNSLGGGGYEGIEESIIVCNSQAELDTLTERMNAVNNASQFTKEISVDFDNESIVAYFQPVRSSGGYGLSADSLMYRSINGSTMYTMYYTVEIPKGATISVLTQPFIFVKTGKLNGPIDFVVVEK